LAPLAIIFSLLSIIIQNNVFDFWIDLVSNKSRPLQSKKINLREYSQIYIVFLLLAISFAITSGFVALIGVGVLLLCYYFYSTPPFRLKRVTLFSKLLISISSLGLVLTGFVLANGSLLSFPLEVLILFLVGFSFAINFIDIKDYLGDKKEKIKTLPVLLGLKKSKLLIGFFFILAYGLSFFVIKNPLSIFPIIIFALIQFILINKKNYNEVPIFITYFISVITLAMLM
jgi:4-hydroxybenzoate polyprenyltransferase